MKFKLYLLFCMLSGVYGCTTSDTPQADVSAVKLEISIGRMEKDLFGIKRGGLLHEIPRLRKTYSGFFDLFTEGILKIPKSNDTLLAMNLEDFLFNPEIREVNQECEKTFQDISSIESEIREGFRHYKYYFPSKSIPKPVTFISGFNYSIVCSDSVLGVSLDMYLGNDCKFYPRLGYPKYKTMKMSKEYVAADALKGWAQTEFEPKEPLKDFLANMIFNGKMMYFLDAVFPDMNDSLKIGYTEAQMKFCKKNEGKIWSVFVEKNLLFSSQSNEYMKFISEGPTSNGFPRESPGAIGIWTGWQMVRKYMKENKQVTLKQLMEEKDAQTILNLSHYKPGV